ncbi:MAG: hypothetical protein ABSB84_02555 [Verrucomicrobiota bacterium]|jgi:hypothetical protein
MKTPREILLKRHQAAEPSLDAIRKGALANLARAQNRQSSPGPLDFLRGFFREYRRHFAAMSAIWLVVVLLNLNAGHSAGLAATIPRGKIPSPQIILASLRENRRQLLEMIQPLESRDAATPGPVRRQPRSERCYETLTV